jgi:glyoxylase-like metal-dependent hydrolase (beta-lactamase superfamily II)
MSYFPFQVGAVECAAISAGSGHFRVQAFFADVPPGEPRPVLMRYGVQTEKIDTPFNCLLIRHRGMLILVDTGAKAKTLLENLNRQGIGREDVSMVVLSHAHADHYGGALDAMGRPTFPIARYILAQGEREQVRTRFAALSPQWIEPETELLVGVRTLPAPGHTPGQLVLKIESQGETLLYTSDVIAHPIHLEYPEWNIVSDADRVEAVRTRASLLAQASDKGWWLFVYHFPFPGLCRIVRDGRSWRIAEQRTPGSL